MGQKHWTTEEMECLQKFIIPHSIYAQGYHDDKNGGMTFEELAKVMQHRMKEQGIENRTYTQTIRFQKYYQIQGKKGSTGPHVRLSKAKLDTVKELRAWLEGADIDGDSAGDEEEDDDDEHGAENSNRDNSPNPPQKRRRLQQHYQPQHHSSNMAPQQRSSYYCHYDYSQPHQQSPGMSVFENMYHPHYPEPQQQSSDMPRKRTFHHHPDPQLSPGGTMRRVYDDEDICPPEGPNFLNIYGARKETEFIFPWFPEENVFTYIEKEKINRRTADHNEHERAEQAAEYNKRKRIEQEEVDLETFSPDKRVSEPGPSKSTSSRLIAAAKKTPTKPAAKRPSVKKPSVNRTTARKPSTSKTKADTPAMQRGSSPAGNYDGEDYDVEDHEAEDHEGDDHEDDDQDSPVEDIDPRYIGDGSDSPVEQPLAH